MPSTIIEFPDNTSNSTINKALDITIIRTNDNDYNHGNDYGSNM